MGIRDNIKKILGKKDSAETEKKGNDSKLTYEDIVNDINNDFKDSFNSLNNQANHINQKMNDLNNSNSAKNINSKLSNSAQRMMADNPELAEWSLSGHCSTNDW